MIEDSAVSRGAEVLARFTEVESGRKADRPELLKALHLAKVTGATLVIAKLDRIIPQRGVPVGAKGQRGSVRGGGHTRGKRPHRRHHGACGPGRARGDLTAHERGAGCGKGAGREAREPEWAESLRRAGKGGVALRAAVSANAAAFAADLAPVLADIRLPGTRRFARLPRSWRRVGSGRGGAANGRSAL